jgi:hypothetical protein
MHDRWPRKFRDRDRDAQCMIEGVAFGGYGWPPQRCVACWADAPCMPGRFTPVIRHRQIARLMVHPRIDQRKQAIRGQYGARALGLGTLWE